MLVTNDLITIFSSQKIIRIVDTMFIMFMTQISNLNFYFIIDDIIKCK